MIDKRTILIIVAMTAALQLRYKAWAQSPSAIETPRSAQPEGVGSVTVLDLHGKIAEVNKAEKEVTIVGPQGRKITLKVENSYNLNAAKVGDPVVARYYEVATIRRKQPGETVPSASVKEGIWTASSGETPGAAAGKQVSIVVSVVAIDRAKGAITVKGPDGVVETVKARYPDKLKRLNVGDQLVVSVARAIAVSLVNQPTR